MAPTPTSGPVVAVLGPVAVVSADPGGPRSAPVTQTQARLLALLVAEPAGVDAGALAAALWGGSPPRTARTALANQVSRLRAAHGGGLVETTAAGYRLGVPTDVALVADLVARAEAATASGLPQVALAAAEEALAWRRGAPYDGLRDELPTRTAARYADELVTAAETLRLAAAVAAGRPAWAVAEAERLVGAAPYDEQRWSLLAQALDRAGRHGEALAVLERARRVLQEELGLDPGELLTATDRALRDGPVTGRAPGPDDVVCAGREGVLAELVDRVARADRVLLRSEEGGGASTVLRELARRLRGRGHTAVLATAVAAPDRPLAELHTLADQLPGSAPPSARSLTDAFVDHVAEVARSRPVTLLVDDLHHVGPSTHAVLERAADQPGVRLVATARAPYTERELDSWSQVELGPLGAEATAVIARTALGAVGDAAADWYHAMSGGNPSFLAVLLEQPGDAEGGAELGAPLAGVVRNRTARLSPAAALAVEVAAVAASGVPVAVLADLVPADGLDEAVAAGVLVAQDGVVRFRHGLVEHVQRRGVAPGRAVELHHAVGVRLTRHGLRAAAAEHLLDAASLDPAGAVAAAAAAAAEASAAGAHLDAARWYERGAAVARGLLASAPYEAVRMTVGHGDELRLAGDPAHVPLLLGAFADALASGRPGLVADAAVAALDLGTTTASGRPHEDVEELLERALAVVPEGEDRARVAGAASLALSMVGHPDRSRQLFEDAERGATSAAVRRRVLPYAYMGLGRPEDAERRHALGLELLGLAEDAEDAAALFEARHLLFSTALQRADGPAVREHSAGMLALVDRVGDVGRRWSALYAGAAVAHLDDDLDRAEALTTDAFTTFGAVAPSRAFAAYGGQLLALRLAAGRVAELRASLEQLSAEQPGVPAWHAAVALAVVDQDPAAAAAAAERALREAPRDLTWLAARVVGGRAAALAGDGALAAAYAAELAPWSGTACWQGTCSYGPVDTTLALLHRAAGSGAATEHATRARAVAQALGAPVFLRDLDELGL